MNVKSIDFIIEHRCKIRVIELLSEKLKNVKLLKMHKINGFAKTNILLSKLVQLEEIGFIKCNMAFKNISIVNLVNLQSISFVNCKKSSDPSGLDQFLTKVSNNLRKIEVHDTSHDITYTLL